MKQLAKQFVKQFAGTRIIRIKRIETHPMGKCYENALEHSKATGSKIVNGWVISGPKFTLQPQSKGILVRHYWNKLNGKYIDTTKFEYDFSRGSPEAIEEFLNEKSTYVLRNKYYGKKWLHLNGATSIQYLN